ncbi:MAG TPA: hypothetical protein VK131_07075 [Candidatus Acidoferrales bacterium]|nr:hypothetical protein [Candidatus Acidoferrales bacterium]
MGQLPDLDEARRRLGLALELIPNDRWVIGGLKDGRLKPIAASDPNARWLLRPRQLTPLARRCLFERRPLTVCSLTEQPTPPGLDSWEQQWPALIYAPVGKPGQRPVGLLILGNRRSYWYIQDDIDYASALALTLEPFVTALSGPLGKLGQREKLAAQMLGQGWSVPEIASGLRVERDQAQRLVEAVLQKLALRSRQQLADLLPDAPQQAEGGYLL